MMAPEARRFVTQSPNPWPAVKFQLPGLLVDDEDVVSLLLYERIVGGVFQYLLDNRTSFRLQSSLRGYTHGKAQAQEFA